MLETTMDNFLLQALQESTGAQLAFSMVGATVHGNSRGGGQ